MTTPNKPLTKEQKWCIAIMVFFALAIIGALLPKSPSSGPSSSCATGWEKACDPHYADCATNWTAHRNDSLLAYTQSAYMNECVSSADALDQYMKDHR